MADLTITAANVGVKTKTVSLQVIQAGEAITQGEPVYKKAADGKAWLADPDAEATAEAIGIAITSAATDEYVVIVKSGGVDLGATLTVGETYVVSTTAGGIAPIGDLTTGDYVTILGNASAAATLDMKINITGNVKP